MAEGIAAEEDRRAPPADLPMFNPLYKADASRDEIFDANIRHYTQSRYCWRHYDIMHGHRSIHRLRPPGAFIFTLVREPMARSMSQLIDLLSHKLSDLVRVEEDHKAPRQLLIEEGIEAALERYPDHPALLNEFDDVQCRTLLREEVGYHGFQAMTPEERAAAAIATMDAQCDFVGVQEQLIESLTVLTSMLGLCPPRSLPRVNDRPHLAHRRNVSPEVRQWMADHNRGDQILYEHACRRFAEHAAAHGGYDLARFEERHVADRCAEISPMRIGPAYVFDVNMAIVGSGFYTREGHPTIDCNRWTGPETDVILYFPVPVDTDLRLRVYSKGWTDWTQVDALTVTVDGEVRPHHLEHLPRMAHAIVFEARSKRPWIKVVVELGRTCTDAEVGRETSDNRMKGFALWGYGYEPIEPPPAPPKKPKRSRARKAPKDAAMP